MAKDTLRGVSVFHRTPQHSEIRHTLYVSPYPRGRMKGGIHGLLCLGLFVWLIVLGTPRAWGENFRRIIVFQEGTPVVVQQTIVVESGSTLLRILPLLNAVVVKLPMDRTPQALAMLQSRPEVVQIHDDPAVSAESLAASEGIEGALITPTTPAVGKSRWNFAQIDFDPGKEKYERRRIRIAVLDTGIDYLHPDLAGRVVGCYNARAGESETDCMDYNGHGTHVAGIIAASATRPDGQPGLLPGMAPKARLYAVRVLDKTGGGYVSDLINGLSWVYNHPKIRLVNMSLGFYKTSPYPLLERVVTMLYKSGVIMVASAGNYRADCIALVQRIAEGEGGDGEGGDSIVALDGQVCNRRVKFPARYPETIAVAATDSEASVTDYSIRGSEVDVAAPGGTRLYPVISTTIRQRFPGVESACVVGVSVSPAAAGEGGDCSVAAGEDDHSQVVAAGEGGDGQVVYGAGSGTSQAAAHVTGLVANMLSKNPLLTPDEVRMILYATAVDLGVSTLSQGAGLIDVEKAVDLTDE